MQISTTVRMDMNDVQEAVIALIKEKIDISDNADVDIHFDAESDIFVVEISSDDTDTSSDPAKKTTRRRRRTKAEIEADKAKEASPEADKADGNQEEPSEPEQPAETPEVEQPAEVKVEEIKEEPKPVLVETIPSNKIFPDMKTSAPVTPEREVDPVVAAKSLFANLGKPTNAH